MNKKIKILTILFSAIFLLSGCSDTLCGDYSDTNYSFYSIENNQLKFYSKTVNTTADCGARTLYKVELTNKELEKIEKIKDESEKFNKYINKNLLSKSEKIIINPEECKHEFWNVGGDCSWCGICMDDYFKSYESDFKPLSYSIGKENSDGINWSVVVYKENDRIIGTFVNEHDKEIPQYIGGTIELTYDMYNKLLFTYNLYENNINKDLLFSASYSTFHKMLIEKDDKQTNQALEIIKKYK